jgi:hypothetical protein
MPEDNKDDSIDKLRESIYYSYNLLNLPEFKGQPGESIEAFLKDFSRATSTFSPERKCLAIKRALTGDAAIYAKKYIKEDLANNNWKGVKAALRDRFLPTDRDHAYRTELRKMTYDKATSTLLGYVDRYAKLYRKVHPKAEDSELIGDVGLNLGADLVRKLNQLSSGWQSLTQFEPFRTLISRLEKDILAYETTNIGPTEMMNTVNKVVIAALQEPMKRMENLLADAKKRTDEVSQEALAAIQHGSDQNRSRRRYPNKRKDREWDDWRQKGNQSSQTNSNGLSREESPRLSELKKLYEQNFGRLNGTCFTCDGHHFKRHCPLEHIEDLKE